jgi:hypothetical protein
MRNLLWINFILVISACGIGGQWMNGEPSAGKNIKPYLHYWLKEGVTTEQRREDSVSCGGSRSDTHPHGVNDRKEKKLMLPGETVWETRERIVKAWKDCMESKGYHYVS